MNNEIIIYQSKDNQTLIDVTFENETVWLNRLQLSLLFDRDIKTIGKHLRNVFREGELIKMQLSQNLRQLQQITKPIKLSITTWM